MRRRDEPEPPWTADRVAAEMATALDLVGPILEAVAGYRQKCIEAGFNETAAETMAVQFHSMLCGGRA